MLTWGLTLSKVSTILKREAVPHESPFECSFYNSSNRDAWRGRVKSYQVQIFSNSAGEDSAASLVHKEGVEVKVFIHERLLVGIV